MNLKTSLGTAVMMALHIVHKIQKVRMSLLIQNNTSNFSKLGEHHKNYLGLSTSYSLTTDFSLNL